MNGYSGNQAAKNYSIHAAITFRGARAVAASEDQASVPFAAKTWAQVKRGAGEALRREIQLAENLFGNLVRRFVVRVDHDLSAPRGIGERGAQA